MTRRYLPKIAMMVINLAALGLITFQVLNTVSRSWCQNIEGILLSCFSATNRVLPTCLNCFLMTTSLVWSGPMHIGRQSERKREFEMTTENSPEAVYCIVVLSIYSIAASTRPAVECWLMDLMHMGLCVSIALRRNHWRTQKYCSSRKEGPTTLSRSSHLRS